MYELTSSFNQEALKEINNGRYDICYEDVELKKSDIRPLVFLDIDGVINSLEFMGVGLPPEHEWYEIGGIHSNDISKNEFTMSCDNEHDIIVRKGHCKVTLPDYMPKLIQSLVKNNEVWFLSAWKGQSNDFFMDVLGIPPLPCLSRNITTYSYKTKIVKKYGDIAASHNRQVFWIEDHNGFLPRSPENSDIEEQRIWCENRIRCKANRNVKMIDTVLFPLKLMYGTDSQVAAVLYPNMLPSFLIPDYKSSSDSDSEELHSCSYIHE